jgi:tRNA(fMet)-specific endonuclease VapC
MIVADTDVLIDFLRDRKPYADRIRDEILAGGLRTTVISRFELLAGAKTDREMRAVAGLLDAVPDLGLESGAADRAASVRRELERQGLKIGMADCLIAGIVIESGGKLLTKNRKHFERVQGLSLVAI